MDAKLKKGLEKAGVAGADRHAFLCVGPDCCGSGEGLATWEILKGEVKRLGLKAMRTKAACFRICSDGPILAIYPEGVYYANVCPERCRRIVEEHLKEGRVVEEWVVGRTGCGADERGGAG